MKFERKVPEWSAEGTEPPASLKASGFESGYKPPAAYFNWFWNSVSRCLTEIHEKMKLVRTVAEGGTGNGSFTSGNYLVGNGADALNEQTPAEVLRSIGAAPKNAAIPTVAAASEDGVAYTATVDGVTELYNGLLITIIPEVVSTSTAVTINVNGLGAKLLRLPLSFNNAAMTIPKNESFFTAGRPITIQFDGGYLNGDGAWKTVGKIRTSAQDLYGTVPVESGGTGADTADAARANLGAVAMATATVSLPVSGWSSNKQTVNVSGVTASNVVLVTGAPDSYTAYNGAGVYCSGQGDGTLTFSATSTPESALSANVLILT